LILSFSGHSLSAWNKFLIIGAMYMGQTFATAFVSQLLPAIYRDQGLPLDRFWILSLGLIPFWFRWLWSPMVDRRVKGRFGRRKSWIVPCTIIAVISYALLSLVEPTIEAIWIVAALFAVQALVVSTQEIAVDAYMVENLQPAERGVGSGVKLYMEAIAEFMALAGLAAIFQYFGWNWTLFAAACLFLVFFIPAFIRKEPLLQHKTELLDKAKPSIIRFLKRTDSWFIIGLLLIGGITFGMFFPMSSAFLIDEGFSISETGMILGIIVVIGMLIGATVAVRTLDKLGMKSTLLIVTLISLPAFIPAFWLSQPGQASLFTTIICLAIPTSVIALIYVVFIVARLEWTSEIQAGTDYSIQSAVFRGGATAAIGVGGFLAAWLGWRGFFIAYPVIMIVVSLAFFFISDPLHEMVVKRSERERGEILQADNL
jgi:MFS family permease